MTPRVGVKTTLTMERAFSGLSVPSGSPTFFVVLDVRNFEMMFCGSRPQRPA
jgi:hypothetical protein